MTFIMGNFVVSCHPISVLVISVLTSNDVHRGLGTLQTHVFQGGIAESNEMFYAQTFFFFFSL